MCCEWFQKLLKILRYSLKFWNVLMCSEALALILSSGQRFLVVVRYC